MILSGLRIAARDVRCRSAHARTGAVRAAAARNPGRDTACIVDACGARLPGTRSPIGPYSDCSTAARLAAPGTTQNSSVGVQQPGNRQRDCMCRHISKVGKALVVNLLLPAHRVELDDLDLLGVVQIGDRRIVEREMTVDADAEAHDVDRGLAEKGRVTCCFRAPDPAPARSDGPRRKRCARTSDASAKPRSAPAHPREARDIRPCGRL